MVDKNILLMEPGYKNKYPPLGLMKIAQYHGALGKRDNVRFIKGKDPLAKEEHWDRIYVTSLFSFEWPKTAEAINYAIELAKGDSSRVFVGGIAASLMTESFREVEDWSGVRFISGLLDKPPAEALQLDDFFGELYSSDMDSTPIEFLTPDYSILDQIDYEYPVRDAYFTYASRGCVRKCKFCGVPKLEGEQRDTESISAVVNEIEKLYGPKKDLILMDNNVVASSKYKEIIAEIRDLGFERGAKLKREGSPAVRRRVDFNQGVDARILCKDPMYLREMATIAIKPLRIAFDHLGVKKPYATAVRYAAEAGIVDLSNYMLYNFHDSPADLYERMYLNIELNEELGIRIFSFPMRYQPVDLKDRSFIGDKWSKYELRSMQIILQATHGVVSGSPSFYRRAFGSNKEEFADLLLLPHRFTFNRTWYEELEGKSELEDFKKAYNKLTDNDKNELRQVLSLKVGKFIPDSFKETSNGNVKCLAEFYSAHSDSENEKVWQAQKDYRAQLAAENPNLVDEEKVEDAGLEAA